MIHIPISEIRTLDIGALLLTGALVELITKSILAYVKRKSPTENKLSERLFHLQYETASSRRLGPQAFVETAKLERKVLGSEKSLEALVAKRKALTEAFRKIVKNISLVLYVIIFLSYYSHNVLSIDGTRVNEGVVLSGEQEEHLQATAFLQGFMFPVSYVGIGMKIARFGLPVPGFGALLVLWSSQVTVGKLIDGIELLL